MEKLVSAKLDLVIRLCEAGYYDYIIVGSGIGGGILARMLVENSERKKIEKEIGRAVTTKSGTRPARVLIIDRGGVLFSTHCLNTPAPRWNQHSPEGSSMDTDMVFSAVKEPVSTVTSQSLDYVGGPIYSIGGRSTVWSLYTPPIDKAQVKAFFPSEVHQYLFGNDSKAGHTLTSGYDAAYRTLTNDNVASTREPYPVNKAIKADVTETIRDIKACLNGLLSPPTVTVTENGKSPLYTISRVFQCCPMAAEFAFQDPSSRMYQMPMGGFSTVSWILERVFNKSEQLNVLAKTRVVAVNRAKNSTEGCSQVESLTVLDHHDKERTLPTGSAKVILSAGSIGTATIALHSGLQRTPNGVDLPVGQGLTDHDIWGTRFKFFSGPILKKYGKRALRLDSWATMRAQDQRRHTPDSERCLIAITINADSFLGHAQDEASPIQYFDRDMKPVPWETYKDFGDDCEDELGHSRPWQDGPPSEQEVVIRILFCFASKLVDENRVLGLPEPVPTIKVSKVDTSMYVPAMQQLAQDIKTRLSEHLMKHTSKDFIIPYLPDVHRAESDSMANENEVGTKHSLDPKTNSAKRIMVPDTTSTPPLPEVRRAGFGVVAHEVGTMRMPSPGKEGSVVDENLKVRGWQDLYACDLSVFPVSPSANPSLTLAALAQRLGSFLEKERSGV